MGTEKGREGMLADVRCMQTVVFLKSIRRDCPVSILPLKTAGAVV